MKSKDPVKVVGVRGTSFEADASTGGSTATEKAAAGEYSTGLTELIGQELTKSDRPELTNAKVVISGGKVLFFININVNSGVVCPVSMLRI